MARGEGQTRRSKGSGAGVDSWRRRAKLLAFLGPSLCIAALAVAAPAFATSSPWELTSVHAPTNVPLKPGVNQVMTLRFHANVGKFLLEFENEQTGEDGETKYLPFDASAQEVQQALEKLKTGEPKTAIGAGNVAVSGGYDAETETGTYAIEFTGALGGRYLGEAPIGLSSEIPSHEETRFEKEEEKAGGSREPEEPEGEAEIATPGYHDAVDYQLIPVNRSNTAIVSSLKQPVRILEKLPPGLSLVELPSVELQGGERRGEGWKCAAPVAGRSEKEIEAANREEEKRDKEEKLPPGAGLTEVECTLVNFLPPNPTAIEPVVYPDAGSPTLPIEASLDIEALHGATSLENHAHIEGGEVGAGGGVEGAETSESAPISSEAAPFGLQLFNATTTGPDAQTYTQAGGHPYAATTTLFFNTSPRVSPEGFTEPSIISRVKDADVKLPAGFYGNPLATLNSEGHPERCSQAQFTEGLPGGPVPSASCPAATQVGAVSVFLKEFGKQPETVALYNLQPPAGVPAEFGFIYSDVPIRLDAHVLHEDANGGEYRVSVVSSDVNEAYDVFGIQVTLWGESADPSHTPERFKNLFERGAAPGGPEAPFLTNPADCAVEAAALEAGARDANLAPVTTALVDSWERPGAQDGQGQPALPEPNWSEAQATSPRVTGCEALNFEPSFSFRPRPAAATEAEAETKEAQGPTETTPPDSRVGIHLPAATQTARNPNRACQSTAAQHDRDAAPGCDALALLRERPAGVHGRRDRPQLDGRGRVPGGVPGGQGHDRLAAARKTPRRPRIRGPAGLLAVRRGPGGRRRTGEAVHRSRRCGGARQACRLGIGQPEHRADHDDLPEQPPAAVRKADPEAEDRSACSAGERAGVHHRATRVGHDHAVERGRHDTRRGNRRRNPDAVTVRSRRPVRDQPLPAQPAVRTRLQRRQRILRAPASTRTSTSRSPARTANRASPASQFTRPRACSARSPASPAVKARRRNPPPNRVRPLRRSERPPRRSAPAANRMSIPKARCI